MGVSHKQGKLGNEHGKVVEVSTVLTDVTTLPAFISVGGCGRNRKTRARGVSAAENHNNKNIRKNLANVPQRAARKVSDKHEKGWAEMAKPLEKLA